MNAIAFSPTSSIGLVFLFGFRLELFVSAREFGIRLVRGSA